MVIVYKYMAVRQIVTLRRYCYIVNCCDNVNHCAVYKGVPVLHGYPPQG